jgi:hypothetical protein
MQRVEGRFLLRVPSKLQRNQHDGGDETGKPWHSPARFDYHFTTTAEASSISQTLNGVFPTVVIGDEAECLSQGVGSAPGVFE